MIKENLKIYSAILLLLGIVFRVYISFQNAGFWSDELTSIYFSKIPFLDALARDNAGPLFQLILRCWMFVFGDSEYSIKALPLGISIISLIIVKRKFSNSVLALMALNPFSIMAATQIKSTSLFELVVIIFIYVNYFEFIKSELVFSKIIKLFLFLILLALTNYASLIFVMVVLLLLAVKSLKNNNFYLNLILYIIFVLVAVFVKEQVLSFTHLSFLRGFSLDSFFTLEKLLNIRNEPDLYFVITSFFLSALVFSFNKKLYSISSLALILGTFYIALSQVLGLNLMLVRYMTPFIVISILSVESVVKANTVGKKNKLVLKIAIILITILNVLQINIVTSGSWKQAAAELCLESEKIKVWGHDGHKYYFPENCAEVSSSIELIENFCGKLIVSQLFVQQVINNNSAYGATDVIKVFGANSIEPVFLLNRNCIIR